MAGIAQSWGRTMLSQNTTAALSNGFVRHLMDDSLTDVPTQIHKVQILLMCLHKTFRLSGQLSV